MKSARLFRAGAVAAGVLLLSQVSWAQDPPPQPPTSAPIEAAENEAKPDRGFFNALVHNLGDDVKHMPRKNSLYWLAAGSAAALAIHPADDEINERMQGSDFADNFFIPGKFIGSSYTIGAAAITTYLVGRHIKSDRGKHLGMDLMESTILSEAITQLIKVAVRRERPIAPDGTQKMVVFLAHWCPHCNREVPVLNEWKDAGLVPEGLQVVGISTAASPEGEHYPPSEWIDQMDWTWPVMADSETQDAALAFGLSGYPTMVILDGDGTVLSRASGEKTLEQLQQFVDDALASAA